MKVIAAQPKLVVQVHQAIVSEVAQGHLLPGSRVIQEQLAEQLGVSRQPVQQALLLLRNQGVLTDAPGRGLIVAPLEVDHVRNLYDIRAVVEGLAFRRAAELNAEHARRLGPAFLKAGREAMRSGSVTELIAADLGFHAFVHKLSRNPLIAPMMDAQWVCTQRVMGDALLRDGDTAQAVWAEHEQMIEAVIEGDADQAEALARRHIVDAATTVIDRLMRGAQQASARRAPAAAPSSERLLHQFAAL